MIKAFFRESRQLQKQNDKLNEDRVAFKEKEVRYKEEAQSLRKQLNEEEHRYNYIFYDTTKVNRIVTVAASRESYRSAITSSLRNCRPPVYHTKMGEFR